MCFQGCCSTGRAGALRHLTCWSHLPPPSTRGRHAGSPTPSPSHPLLRQSRWPHPTFPTPRDTFSSSSSLATATINWWWLPMTPHPHPSTNSTMRKLTPCLGFSSVFQVSLRTSFPREPSYIVSAAGGRGRFPHSRGAETRKGWGEQEGRGVTLPQPHGTLQDFTALGKWWITFTNTLNV